MIYWITFIGLAIWYNWYKITVRGVKPTYFNSNWARGVFGLMCLVLTYKETFDPLVNGLDYLPFIAFECTSFWLLFDPILNLTRGKPIGYKGASSGYLDRLPKWAYWILKAVALGALFATIYHYKLPLF